LSCDGLQRNLSHLLKKVCKACLTVQLDAHGKKVHKESDQPFGLELVAVREIGANHYVVLPREAGKQQLEARRQRHKEGAALRTAKGPQVADKLPGHVLAVLCSPKMFPLLARAISWQ